MKMVKQGVYVLLVFLMFSFIVFGYAALTDELTVEGQASLTPHVQGIFITDITVVARTNGISDNGSEYIKPTNIKSNVSVSASGSITYKITVENTSDITYWYRGIVVPEDLTGYRNDLVNKSGGITITTNDKLSDISGTFNNEDWIPPHTVREFYAIYSFGASALGSMNTFLNFSFGEKVASYGDEVHAILNDPEKYEYLSRAFDEAYAEQNGKTVIGNIGSDAEIFNTLFGGDIMLDGEPVTVMIQRDNIDGKSTGDSYSPTGPTGCEYTLYITTGDGKVYAVSYAIQEGGVWQQIGELYEGTVNNGTYTDGEGTTTTAMDITTWKADQKTYTVFAYGGRIVNYTVGNPYGNSYQQQTVLSDIMSMEDVELYNQLDDHPILKDTYTILKEKSNSTETEVVRLREAYNSAVKYFNVYNDGQEFKIIRSKYSRAEIIASLESLSMAIEYYLQSYEN